MTSKDEGGAPPEGWIACTPKHLPAHLREDASAVARECFPGNAPLTHHLAEILAPGVSIPQAIAALTTKYWGPQRRVLTVSFLEPTTKRLADKIIKSANDWYALGCGILFKGVQGKRGDIRITRDMAGYWSYLGTDIRMIPMDEPTMCLQGFSVETPDSEYRRVVRHEFGHTDGFPHEHMRADLIARLDRDVVIREMEEQQGWTEAEIVQQVFTPLEERSLLVPPGGTLPPPDETSIMCYQFPPEMTLDKKGIPGGLDINDTDAAYARAIYPRATARRGKKKAE